MRTPLLLLCACVLSCTSTPAPNLADLAAASNQSLEFAGVYTSTPEEDYFTPCGIEPAGDTWSLRFRDNEPHAPFLKKVTAIRGLPPLTHFIRVRGRLSPRGRYNVGFQTRELAVDSVLDVKETLEPCRGFGIPAAWNGVSERFRDARAIALSNDRRLFALMDNQGQISISSTETGALVQKVAPLDQKDQRSSTGPMTFSNDGQLLAVGGSDGIVRVWDAREGRRIFSLTLKDSAAAVAEAGKIPPRPDAGWVPPPSPNSYTPARDLVFNKRGTVLATSNMFSAIVWSMKSGEKLAEFKIGSDFRRRLYFVRNDDALITADGGRTTLRSYLDIKPVAQPGPRAPAAENLTVSIDGRSIAARVGIDSVILWSVDRGPGRVLKLPGFVTGVAAFSPDAKTIAVAGGMFGLYVYDTRTGFPIRAFQNFPGPLSSAWFAADGKSIITRSTFDDRLRIVYVDPRARPATQAIFDDSLTAKLPLGPPPSTAPRTVGGIVTGPKERAVAGADVEIRNGDAPDSVIARTMTSAGGYFSFPGIRFRHVVVRVQKAGFATGVKYIHVNRWENDGPWGIELTPDARPAESGGG